MAEILPLPKLRPQAQALHFSYEKAGVLVHDQPIPWNADQVFVEATLRLAARAPRRKHDFTLKIPTQTAPISADSVRQGEGERAHVQFRLPTPQQPLTVHFHWRDRALGELTLPTLSRADFMHNLGVALPSAAVLLGTETVVCHTFVANQCKGLVLTGMLTSPTSLVPVLDLDLTLELRNEATGEAQRMPVRLSSTQLNARQALLTILPTKLPRKRGSWLVRWCVEDRELASQRLRAIAPGQFQKSLRVSSTRFVLQHADGTLTVSRHLPDPGQATSLAPCFLVHSKEPGMAGRATFEVQALIPGALQPLSLTQQEVVLTDGRLPISLGLLACTELAQIASLQLYVKGSGKPRLLETLSLRAIPTAQFTSEGGFSKVEDYTWSASADEELDKRLKKLLEQ